MKKTVYKKLGISIIASTLLASQLSTVSALSVISSTGEEYEVSETLQDSPGTNNFSLPNVSPTYGQYYTNQSEVIIGKNDLVKVKNTLQYPYSTSAYVESEFRGSPSLHFLSGSSVTIAPVPGRASYLTAKGSIFIS
ncbi:V8-like Glu-specific endopeptidase [Streptococcus pneumoniae]|nr:V8-like Glu-specific endopeptidase [Streptococcus pneumoniae]